MFKNWFKKKKQITQIEEMIFAALTETIPTENCVFVSCSLPGGTVDCV